MEYLDERTIGLPTCSKEELRRQIKELEIKNFGHTTSKNTAALVSLKRSGVKKVYSGKKNGLVSK